MANANFDLIASTTLDNYRNKLVENVFSSRPFFHFLNQAGQIRTVSGGRKIVIPLLTSKNTTFGSYADYDTLDTTAQSGITAAEYPWRQLAVTIALNGLEVAQNASEQEVVNIVSAKIEQAEETFKEELDEMLITSDGTGNSNKDFYGLANVVNQNGSSIGGIDPSSDTWWQSHIDSTSEVLTVGAMRTAYYTVSKGNDSPNICLTTQALYQKYEELLADNIRYTDTKVADAGFNNVLLLDTPVMYDEYVTAQEMYLLNTNYLRLVGHADNWFRTTPFKSPTNQDAKFAQIICYGNLTCSSRERQAVLTNKTTS